MRSLSSVNIAKDARFFILLVLANGVFQVVLAKPGKGLSVLEVLCGVLLIATVCSFCLKQLLRSRPFEFTIGNGVCVLLFLFLLLCFPVNFTVAYLNKVGVYDWVKSVYGFSCLALVFVISEEIQSRDDIKMLIIGLFGIILVSVSYELLEVGFSIGYTVRQGGQIESEFLHYRPTLVTLLVGVCMSLTFRGIFQSFLIRTLCVIIFLILIIRIALSGSRFLIAFAFLSPFLLFFFKWVAGISSGKRMVSFLLFFDTRYTIVGVLKTVLKGSVVIIVIGVIVLTVSKKSWIGDVVDNFRYRFSRTELALNKRIVEQHTVFEFAKEKLVLGHGFGSKVSVDRPGKGVKEYAHVHNIFLQLFKGGGLLLVLSYLSTLVLFLKSNFAEVKRNHDKLTQASVIVSIMVVLSLLMYGQISVMLSTLTANFYVAVFMGITLSLVKFKREKSAMHDGQV